MVVLTVQFLFFPRHYDNHSCQKPHSQLNHYLLHTFSNQLTKKTRAKRNVSSLVTVADCVYYLLLVHTTPAISSRTFPSVLLYQFRDVRKKIWRYYWTRTRGQAEELLFRSVTNFWDVECMVMSLIIYWTDGIGFYTSMYWSTMMEKIWLGYVILITSWVRIR